MILDANILTVYKTVNTAAPGKMPDMQPVEYARSWYGWRDHEAASAYTTDPQRATEYTIKIRAHRIEGITARDMVDIGDGAGIAYEIARVYQGRDEDSGQLISDITIKRATQTAGGGGA